MPDGSLMTGKLGVQNLNTEEGKLAAGRWPLRCYLQLIRILVI